MKLKLLYFASLRDIQGREADSFEVPAGTTVADLVLRALCMEAEEWRRRGLLVAVNRRQVGWETAVADGDEVAFMPPLAGG